MQLCLLFVALVLSTHYFSLTILSLQNSKDLLISFFISASRSEGVKNGPVSSTSNSFAQRKK